MSKVKTTEISVLDPTPELPAQTDNKATTLFRMIERLCSAKTSHPDKVAEMLSVWERLNAHQAKADFDSALATVKPLLPIIVKNNEVVLGANGRGYQYEDLATISNAIDKPLAAHGLSYRFTTSSTPETVTVTCKLSHISGHTEENSLTGPIDKSGSKNAIQALGSSVTYLQRYTLKAALGLAAGKDTDARSVEFDTPAQTDTISTDQVKAIRSLLDKTKRSEDRLCKHYKVSKLEDLLVGDFVQAQAVLQKHLATGEVSQ